MNHIASLFGAALTLASAIFAQVPPAMTPFTHAGDLLVTDTGIGRVLRLADLNLDGDLNDAGEVTVYVQGVVGTVTLGFPTAIAVDRRNVVFVADATADAILRLEDLDGNGDCMGLGEARVWYTPSLSATPVPAPSIYGMVVSLDGAVYVANFNSSAAGAGFDDILKFVDLNNDGDALDAGECTIYATFTNASIGASVPTNLGILPDGSILYTETGSQSAVGAIPRGVWRLHDDVIPNGHCNDPGEITLWYSPPSAAATIMYGLAVDRDGTTFVTDTSFERVLKARDIDSNNLISLGTEESTFFTVGAPSSMWTCAIGDGLIAVVEDTTPDRIYFMRDVNNDGDAQDVGEKVDVYTDTAAAFDIGSPRAIAFLKGTSAQFTSVPLLIGQTANLVIESSPANLVSVYVGAIPAAISVAPYGVLSFDPLPGTYVELFSGIPMGPSGEVQIGIPIPYDPALLSLTLIMQGIGAGPSELRLAPSQTLTFQ